MFEHEQPEVGCFRAGPISRGLSCELPRTNGAAADDDGGVEKISWH